MSSLIHQYQLERSVHFRVALTRENIILVLEQMPIEVDSAFIDELTDTSRNVTDVIKKHSDETATEIFSSEDADVYVIFHENYFDVVFISYAGEELLLQVALAVNEVLI